MLEFTKPVVHHGYKFDRGMILYEFDALREPEKYRFPVIGDWVRKHCEMGEIPKPSMLWRGKIVPDLYIANQLDAVAGIEFPNEDYVDSYAAQKHLWPADHPLSIASRIRHGDEFHETFIEPMCIKIAGRKTSEMSAKYHRAIWLPLYWCQTLRKRESLRTPFFYPKAGYAGAVYPGGMGGGGETVGWKDFDSAEIGTAYVVATPIQLFSVLFVVDASPIYRITDQDACAGIDTPFHRYVVEYRGHCSVSHEMQRLNLIRERKHIEFSRFKMTLPTIRNVLNGWKPRPHINDQIWSQIESEAIA